MVWFGLSFLEAGREWGGKMSLTVLNPRVHLIRETATSRFFQRRLGSKDPMTFWHSHTGMWVLALWVHRGKRIVEELEDLGPNCEVVTPEFVKMVIQNYGPVDYSKKKKRLLSRHSDNIRRQNEAILADQERWNWLKKKTKDKLPIPYAYSTPISGGAVLPPKGLK